MSVGLIQWIALFLFLFSILHTFLVKRFHHFAKKFSSGSVGENLFQLLGEVEIVFGLWGMLLLIFLLGLEGPASAINYLESRNFAEPVFVFAVLIVCSTRPILDLAEWCLIFVSKRLPVKRSIGFFVATLILGPLLGSFITEPAAMTVTALILLEHFYQKDVSMRFKYAVMGVLFVNISIGGTLTSYAAPPVLMVSKTWGWGSSDMFFRFGWKGIVACMISVLLLTLKYQKELSQIQVHVALDRHKAPRWVQAVHIGFLCAMVASAHHPILVIGLFLFFLGFVDVTNEHQESVRLKEGFMVSFFLAGLVLIGGLQDWWLTPILTQLSAMPLYLGSIALTAFADNAALTYLGSLVPSLSESSKYALLAGSVVGGGLTVIANAPNPAGYSILQVAFNEEGISPIRLLKAALLPTFVAALCFRLLGAV